MLSSSYPSRGLRASDYLRPDVVDPDETGGTYRYPRARRITVGSADAAGDQDSETGSVVSTSTMPTVLGKQNARSYLHSEHYGADSALPHDSSADVREQTAELANIALSDVGVSVHIGTPPPPLRGGSTSSSIRHLDGDALDIPPLPPPASRLSSGRPFPSATKSTGHVWNWEPVGRTAPDGPAYGFNGGSSYLTHLFRKDQVQTPTIVEAAGSGEPTPAAEERDHLLPKHSHYGSVQGALQPGRDDDDDSHDERNDIEAQVQPKSDLQRPASAALTRFKRRWTWKLYDDREKITKRDVWEKGVVGPVKHLPAVFLGLLLNVLDGLSYGMILFPVGESVFSELGPDGLSMFYVSCIVSQLVYSCGGSGFKGGIGSEMIEVVPFFHKMAFTIMAEVGQDNPKAIIATTILSYAISSVLTGAVFFLLGYLRLGTLIGFFPRHILVGCIGGVGWFLVATGIEVCARLEGSLRYDLETLAAIFRPDTFMLWTIPLGLAVLLIILQKFIKSSLFMPLYFLSIPFLFHIIVAAVPELGLAALREKGWVFDTPSSGAPFWHFYTLYDFKAVEWTALMKTVPAMFALTFFGILHVPINVPALGVSTGIDNVNVDRELVAHGLSNALSGFAGSIQNYLVYSNSILFVRAGGDSRVAGVMLAIGTAAIMAAGPAVIGFIPIMVVGALIFLLGIELMKEALYDTWGKLSKLEYLTICAIVVTMGAWDFVIGILIGVLLACVSLVVQTSQKSPIRATYSGVVARSTVRRHPTQQRFLREAGRQIHVVKLAGYMFFGTITSVEKSVRELLEERNFHQQPVRFIIIDLLHVSGIDFSAAEAFTRMRRLMQVRNVEMIISGVTPGSEIGKGLRAVGVWADDGTGDSVMVFLTLNAALECCENEFLKALYNQGQQRASPHLDVPKSSSAPRSVDSLDGTQGSPRRALIHQAAATTLRSDEFVQSSKWQNFKQPLPLILQTFQEMTDKNEDFWFKVVPFFTQRSYPEGTVVFRRSEKATAFYLIEEGIFRADYDLDQGKYSESIVAGTTCGELPFFSETLRTATVVAEKDVKAWVLDETAWKGLEEKVPEAAKELLKISLKLTTERMHAITSYVLTSAG